MAVLGSGGMGRVYEAMDEKLGRRVALKVLAPHLAGSGSASRRFEQEAWIEGRLDHPNLVKVFERGQTDGLSWFAMQYLDGGSLSDVIAKLADKGKDETLGLVFGTRAYVVWAIERTIEAARGLDHAHARGVVHRDVKPANLLLSRERGTVALADFGIAMEASADRLTRTGAGLGTVSYMAPEQLLGQRDRIGPWTDVYSLGCTLFHLLTLELPYASETDQAYVQQVLTGAPRRAKVMNAQVGRDLETVLRRAMEKEPAHRYRSAADFADDLRNILEFRPITARPPGPGVRVARWIRRRPIHAALIAVLALATPSLAILGQRAAAHRRLEREARIQRISKDVLALEHQEGRYADLVERATELLRLSPDDVSGLRSRANALKRLADAAPDQASRSQHLARALADADHIAALAPSAGWPLRLRGSILRRLGRTQEEAAVVAEADRRTGPSDEDLRAEAFLAYQAGEYRKVVDLLDRFLARNPAAPEDIYRRGFARLALEDQEGALVDLRTAVALDPGEYHFHIDLARALDIAKRPDEAQRHLDRAIELSPGEARAWVERGNHRMDRGRRAFAEGDPGSAAKHFEAAEADALRAIEVDPVNGVAHVNVGTAVVERNRASPSPGTAMLQRAVEYFEKGRSLLGGRSDRSAGSPYVAALVNLCDLFIQQGPSGRALDACLEATRLLPDEATAFYNLAGAYALLGRHEEAFDALARDFDLGDHDHQTLAADPWFSSLRDDPRFTDLLSRMKRASEAQGARVRP